MLEYLKWTSLEYQRQQICLEMLYKINNSLVDINPESFFRHSDPRTRGSQRLCQEQTQHPVFFHSFFPHTVSEWNLLPTSTSSAPSLESFQSRLSCSTHNLQPAPTSPWTSRSILLTTSAPVVYCFYNSQGTDCDHFLTHIAAGLTTLCMSPVLDSKKKKKT